MIAELAPATLAIVEIIRTLCVCAIAGAMIGWVIWWHRKHGPDKKEGL